MYQPAQFREERCEVMHQLISAHPFGALVTLGDDGLNANQVPFELDSAAGPLGTLRAHVARSNPMWREARPDVEPLAIFQGPQAYISPSWYATKRNDGKAVPTWNYMVVHAYGRIRIVEDRDWLLGLLQRLTNRHEASQPTPWRIEDAPADYIDKLLGAIVGIEISVTSLVGKWKTSQNQPAVNRDGVVNGLRLEGGDNAIAMAEIISRL